MADTPNDPELELPTPDDDASASAGGDEALQSELLDDIALEQDEGAADEQLSIVDEAGEGDVANELDEDA